MDLLFQQLFDDPWGRLLLRHATDEGLARAGLFILVAARLAGLLCVGLLLGRTLLTWQVRIGLIVLLTLVVAPTLPLANETMDQVEIVVTLLCEVGLGAVMGLGVSVFLSG